MKLDLEFTGEHPAGWTILEASVVVKCLDEAGTVRLYARTTPGLSDWEDAGMLIWSLDAVRSDLQGRTEEGGP